MREAEVQTPDEALIYVIDCTLATVSKLSLLKNPPKNELKRQIGIAQKGINFMSRFDIDYSGTRAEEITGTVQEWSDEIREREFGVPEPR